MTRSELDATGNEQQEVELVVDRDDLEALLAEAGAQGVEATPIDESGFLDPFTVSVLLLGGTTAIGAVMYWLEQRKGGQVFDLRPNAPKQAYRSRDVAYGLVILIAADGKVTVEVKEPKGAFGIVVDAIRQAFADQAKATLDVLKSTAEAVVGDKASVTSEPLPA
jgi:hypothetical protein